MDALEGFLIGPVWGDNDASTSTRHTAYIWIAIVVVLGVAATVVKPALGRLLPPIVLAVPLFVVLMVAAPLLSPFYYRASRMVRALILLTHALTYLVGFSLLATTIRFLVHHVRARVTALAVAHANGVIEATTTWFGDGASLTAMIIGLMVGGFVLLLEALLAFGLLLWLPIALMAVIQRVRTVIDRTLARALLVRLKRLQTPKSTPRS